MLRPPVSSWVTRTPSNSLGCQSGGPCNRCVCTLILLCATLERGWPPERAVQLRRRAIDKLADRWRWLDPQLPLGTLTIASLSEAADADDRGQRLQAWAQDVWTAYQPHHAGVRRWVDTLLT